MGKPSWWFTFGALFFFIIGLLGLSAPVAEAAAWQTKVDPWVLSTASSGETEFLILLNEQMDLSQTKAFKNKNAQGHYVFETLTTLAERSQKPLQMQLDALGVQYKSYWIVNAFWV